jgi:methionyl-tRNA formyltransferase
MNKLRIVFMGTPEFAVGILDSIIKHNYEVAGVITAPDKPAGRGQKIRFSAVKEYALQNNMHLMQPVNLKDESCLEGLKSLQANLKVVVAFRMLPKAVWDMPEYGTFNLHASLLPDYRGAAPINWAIMNGDQRTGVTTFFIDDKIDTGHIILSQETVIDEADTAGTLHDRLMELGSAAVISTLQLIENGNAQAAPQENHEGLRDANKLTKENCKIDWNRNMVDIYNHIRGLSPYPAAWCYFNTGQDEQQVRIYAAKPVAVEHEYHNGKVIIENKTMKIAAPGGFVLIKEIQFPGKRKMATADLLNGMTFSDETYAR